MGIIEVEQDFARHLTDHGFALAETDGGLQAFQRSRPDTLLDVVWVQTTPPSGQLLGQSEADARIAPARLTFSLLVVRDDGGTLSLPLATRVSGPTRIGLLLDPPLDWWWGTKTLIQGEPLVVGDDQELRRHLIATFDEVAEPWFANQVP